jgi:hypothetical protein
MQGTANNRWVLDIAGTFTVDVVVQFLHLWPQVQAIPMREDVPYK